MPVLTPEQQAREQIAKMLDASGWRVQTRQQMNRTAVLGVGLCEFLLPFRYESTGVGVAGTDQEEAL